MTEMQLEQDTTFYTATMARVLAGQGRFEDAARIYRHLLAKSPGDPDLETALSRVSAQAAATGPHQDTVSALVGRWVRLMLRQRMLGQLERMRIPAGAKGDEGDR